MLQIEIRIDDKNRKILERLIEREIIKSNYKCNNETGCKNNIFSDLIFMGGMYFEMFRLTLFSDLLFA